MNQPNGHHLELVTNADIRPQPRAHEKELQFNKIPRQCTCTLMFKRCSLRAPPFAPSCWHSSLQRAAHRYWGTCLSQKSYFQPEGRMDSLGPASTGTSMGTYVNLVMDGEAVALPDLTCVLVTSLELDFSLDLGIYCILCLFQLFFQYSILYVMCFIHKKHTVSVSFSHSGFQFCHLHTPIESRPQNCLYPEGSW